MANREYNESVREQMDVDAYDHLPEMTEEEMDEMEAQTEAEYLLALDEAVAMVRNGVWN
jgi:hypothetical protein